MESLAQTTRILTELRDGLVEQIARVRGEDFDSVSGFSDRAGQLLAALPAGPIAPEAEALAREVGRLHRELVLTLALRRKEVGEQLVRVRRGGRMRRAYQ